VGLDALAGALLQPEQDLRDDCRAHAGEADLPGSRHWRLGQPPGGLVGLLAGLAQPAQPLQVRVAVAAAGRRQLPRAGRDCAGAVRRQRGHARRGREDRGIADAQELVLGQVLRAERPRRLHPRPRAAGHRAGSGARVQPPVPPRRRQEPGVFRAEPGLLQPAAAVQADARAGRAGRLAARDLAGTAAQQRVRGVDRQHPRLRVPPGPGQERRLKPLSQRGRLAGLRQRRCLFCRRGHGPQRGHRACPAASRGLGTLSTAARSRDGSG
jgi:hypothetical protein